MTKQRRITELCFRCRNRYNDRSGKLGCSRNVLSVTCKR